MLNPIHKFRCHSLAELMTEPKKKGELLSEGAKTAVRKIAREIIFGVRGKVESKYLTKGLMCEQDSINLLSRFDGRPLSKNEERRENEWLTGEPDIIEEAMGTDIKTSWSIDTFPITPEEADDNTYAWQCRGYMMLFDKPAWRVAYCLVDTPQELISYEDPAIHRVSHLPPFMRVTQITYQRDMELEAKIKEKTTLARQYLGEVLKSIRERHELILELNPEGQALAPDTATRRSAKADFLNA